jgi:hypothetical protein
MRPVRSKRVTARDRRLAAVHEAGHVVVAAHFGLYPARARISRAKSPMPDQRAWIGRVQFAGLDLLSSLERRMLGCAGAAAELCWQHEDIHLDYWIEADRMSESDWRLAGCPLGEPDDMCIEALEELQYLLSEDGPLWSDLLRQARQLIVDAR